MRRLFPLASGGVRAEAVTRIGSGPSATYPVVTPVPGGVMAAWSEGGEHSTVRVRRLSLQPACSEPQRAEPAN
jgi:hypothetical protein